MFSVIGLNEDIYIHPTKNKKRKEVKKRKQEIPMVPMEHKARL